ncbi:non-hydrolyzing UDP-N-acetylglucosamine 2-epimerase [Amycolatopsis anabasis]|uniref:non-hydrolyzing UDP-N-acetylglucosamine 2-epimerase n=1 Tax=Amycolatopsis anabasis TaxID=1840409 RepID=UPI00131C144F|nr:UDP-N-acetylglucosamine 2-epimerase (non-hydrolyzing) [Amycolatopsis anabasis]
MTAPEIHLVAGTRPEAIKIAPVALELAAAGRMRPVIVASGQHPGMIGQALRAFALVPDEEFILRRATGSQAELYSALLPEFHELWTRRRPDAVLVQGDTASAVAAALAAFWLRIPVVHLEAGLRSHDLDSPFPEEANRRLIATVAALHLAPTPRAAEHLRAEGIGEERILTVGNTAVDAVRVISSRNREFAEPALSEMEELARTGARRLVLVTVHRRESWGAPMRRVLAAVRTMLREHPDVQVVLPAHPNPAVRQEVERALAGEPRALVTAPLDYPDLVRLLRGCVLALSDSGGIQEEAPSFGVPVLILRDTTERQEAVEWGCATLVGTEEAAITAAAAEALARPARAGGPYANPFGDAATGARAEHALAWLLGLAAAPRPAWDAVPGGVLTA